MSKALFICYKNKNVPPQVKDRIKTIEKAILPDNLAPNLKDLVIDNGTLTCIFNPVALKQREGNSICLGITSEKYWWESNNKNNVFDGSYAIFRGDQHCVELQTDAVASRSIWYYKDDEKIIASNSQLAIIYFLDDFVFNETVIPWMLSSGTLGPYLSWDSRIKLVRPQTTLKLNKKTWKVRDECIPIVFGSKKTNNVNENIYLDSLTEEIYNSTKLLPFNKKLLLPLSGGYDSRGILLSLEENNKKVPSITWGSKKAINQKGNDAYIAKKLAEHYGLKHNYVHTEDFKLEAQTVIDRFIINSEGRTDNIAGYMDGFEIWNSIFKDGYSAIIRGDEGFGWKPVYSEQHAKTSVGLNLITDFNKFKDLNYEQVLPEELKRNTSESIKEYRDRLYHCFRLPIVLGALNETKSSYVEIANPLLNYSILQLVRMMPDELRDDKKTFRNFVERRTPQIPFATKGANIDYRIQLKSKAIVKYFIDSIKNSELNLIPSSFINKLIRDCQLQNDKSFKEQFKREIKRFIPITLKSYLKGSAKNLNHIDNNLLLFRVFIIYKMNQLIKDKLKEIKK